MNGHGGARKGAGRKKTDRVQLCIYVTPETLEVIAASSKKTGASKGKVVDVAVRHMVADGFLDDVHPSVFGEDWHTGTCAEISNPPPQT